MSGPSIHAVTQERGVVHVTLRQWDGIDRPDYTYVEIGNAASARHYAQLLIDRADDAEKYVKADAAKSLKDKRDALAALKADVARLEAVLAP